MKWLAEHKDAYEGARCFVIGCGPSLANVDLSLLKDEVTFGVNGVYMIDGFKSTFYSTISAEYWRYHVAGIKSVRCERRFIPDDMKELGSDVPTTWLKVNRYPEPLVPESFSYDPTTVVQLGGTVIFVCLQLAYYMGFTTAILLGVDHNYDYEVVNNHITIRDTDTCHFRPDYSPPGRSFHYDIRHSDRAFMLANDAFSRGNRKIYNATIGTKLDIFEKIALEDVL